MWWQQFPLTMHECFNAPSAWMGAYPLTRGPLSCSIPHRTQRSNPVHPLIDYSAISIYNVDSTYDVLLAPSPEISIPIHPATSMRQPSQTAFFLGLVLSSSNQVEGIWFCIGVNLVCVFVVHPHFDRLCSKQKRETYPLITILMPSRLLGWWRIWDWCALSK